jgi:hypothetical protein
MAKTGIFGYSGGGIGSGGGPAPVPAPQTPTVSDISGVVGMTGATFKSFTFIVFKGTILIDGFQFGRGSYSYGNGSGTLNPISYDGSGSTDAKLLIQL